MPVLLNSILKDQAKSFLRDNEVAFEEGASRDALIALIRETLTSAGLDPNSLTSLDAVPWLLSHVLVLHQLLTSAIAVAVTYHLQNASRFSPPILLLLDGRDG